MSIIADVGNKDYYRTRAIELILEGEIRTAIGLLALSLL